MNKTSPLSGIYRNYPVKLSEVSGWQIAESFGNEENELKHLPVILVQATNAVFIFPVIVAYLSKNQSTKKIHKPVHVIFIEKIWMTLLQTFNGNIF